MAVMIETWAVVARRAVVESTLDGGIERWRALVPNERGCIDPQLCCVGFMHFDDAASFLRTLEAEGLAGERGGSYQDAAIVHTQGIWRHECRWLDHGHYAGAEAVWLRGCDPEPLVVPLSYRPTATMVYVSPAEARERFEFLRSDGDVDVYWDKQEQCEMYMGRTDRRPPRSDAHEQAFQATVDSLEGLLSYSVEPVRLGWLQRRRLRKGIAALEQLTESITAPWRVWFFLGCARRSLPDPEGAWQAFRAAYDDNPDHKDVAREYAGQCVALGRGDEAVALGRRACERHPDDAGLRSNLALALMIAGNMDAAEAEVRRAREMDPDDPITQALERMIDAVRRGELPRPDRYP